MIALLLLHCSIRDAFMLSYLHGFHAGNFADVHKHTALVLVVQALQRKPGPLAVLDTHAGRGLYDLQAAEALKTGEFSNGIARLWHTDTPPELSRPYLELIQAANPGGELRHYPGSPRLTRQLLRPQDRLMLCELHPEEYHRLRHTLGRDARTAIHRRDGFEALNALLPPAERRGLVLIDPSYEVKTDYLRVVDAVAKACQRWPQGCYLLWYPLLGAGRHENLVAALQHSGLRKILQCELQVSTADRTPGLYGSGLLLINPPWLLDEMLAALSRSLAELLVQDAALARTRWLVPE